MYQQNVKVESLVSNAYKPVNVKLTPQLSVTRQLGPVGVKMAGQALTVLLTLMNARTHWSNVRLVHSARTQREHTSVCVTVAL